MSDAHQGKEYIILDSVTAAELDRADLPEALASAFLDVLKSLKDVPQARGELRCVGPPVGCGNPIPPEEYASWDNLTKKEYHMSALCSSCQDVVFKDSDDEPECTCDTPCCEVNIEVGTVTCGSQHCPIHGEKNE